MAMIFSTAATNPATIPIHAAICRAFDMADSPPAALIVAPRSPRRRGQRPAHRSTGTEEGQEEKVLLLLLLTAVAGWATMAYRHHQQQQQLGSLARPTFIYERRVFRLAALPPGNAERLFRFTEQELYQLLPLLSLEEVPWRSRLAPTPEAALCVVCARLAYPGRWVGLCSIFRRSEAWLSTVFNDIVIFLAAHYKSFQRGLRACVGFGGFGGLSMAPFGAIAAQMIMWHREQYTLATNANTALTGKPSARQMA
ncbi:hypothetical protein VE00_05544 [Pseudogymnoascus sp. WSF 3629]|nr:hypothetical protein VE00_05544 [Pseudogymnoascus sp. WSF 3629]